MRLYHFLSAVNALDDLRRKQIKLSRIDELNDPFELWCVAQEARPIRAALRYFKETMAMRYGMLCFTKHWHNPVLWSHYADSHRGVCLGFDVDNNFVRPVDYLADRPPLMLPPTDDTAKQLLYTKYRDWSYEEEFRSWSQLPEVDAAGHYFYQFDEKLRLREVIAGPLCRVGKLMIEEVLSGYDHVGVLKARLAFRRFQVVEDKQGFHHERGEEV